MSKVLTRRQFVATTAGLLGLALGDSQAASSPPPDARASGAPAPRTVVLFQGDSITDAWRDRKVVSANQGAGLGTGYAFLIAAGALRDHPEARLRFFNRGIGGSRLPDLQARWDAEALALRPNIVSIMIGVNDFWHKLTRGYTGTVADYEKQYTALLQRTRQALPKARIVVIEPFVLRCGEIDERWFPEFDQRQAVAARVAKRSGATYVPLQEMLTSLARETSPEYWAWDGAHPTAAGDAAIAERWRQVVGL
ncbi:MAG TPA: GDSL-type esterase/lipase family protein [Candidatus Polarisedimenticolia bacterium]|nr:GDSL-type esterase/lipase family protein [Candidatus Polarisedimenticolia bacterium]